MRSKETSHSIKSLTIMPFILISILPAFFTFSTRASGDVKTISSDQISIRETWGTLPLSFEPNQGQTCDAVRFVSRGPSFTLSLMPSDVVLAGRSAHGASLELALWIKLVSTNPVADIAGFDPLMGKSNYFIGRDPKKWRPNIPNYARVKYTNIYRGIDLIFHGNQGQIEYDFVIAPGADPNLIMLEFGISGSRAKAVPDRASPADIASNRDALLRIDTTGDLIVKTGLGEIRQKKPLVYQEIDRSRREIGGRYVLKGKTRVGFEVASYDTSRSLIVDFGGSVGTAGVGDSKPLRKFAAPVETSPGVNTGVALMGLGTQQMVQLELRNQEGNIVARAVVPLGARSHFARLVTELPWDIPPDFSNFSGTLTAAGTAELAAIVLRISPGQLATLPVAEKS